MPLFQRLQPLCLCLLMPVFALVACSRRDDSGQQERVSDAIPERKHSTERTLSDEAERYELTQFEGVVYLSRSDSIARLAIERGDGTVFLVVGKHNPYLRRLTHRKVEVTGFVRPNAAGTGLRDTIEVIDFEVVRGGGKRFGKS